VNRLTLLAMLLFAIARPAWAQREPVQGEAALCHAGATRPALLIEIAGLKDRAGELRIELYPDHDPDFLGDKNKLIAAGKTFRRILFAVPPGPRPVACLGVPAPGRYALVIIHDRQAKRKFNALSDGIAFPGDPKLSFSQPPASKAWVTVGGGVDRIRVRMQYLHGFLQVGPVRHPIDEDLR